MNEPIFLDASDVEALHHEMIARFGGLPGLRDTTLLLSALGRAENRFAYGSRDTTDLFDVAAAYAFGIARNHPFNDANKRTAWGTCLTFLDMNEVFLVERVEDAVETMVRLAAGQIGEAAFAAWLRTLPEKGGS